MSPQADYVVANGTGAAVRSDINGQLAAIVSQNSGATEPTTTYAYMWWADTTTGLLKIRNAANNAWVTVGTLASANLGLATLASPTFTGTVTIPAGASISGFAPLASPTLTGTPAAPTASAGTNTTQLATTAYVVSQAIAKTGGTMTGDLVVPSLNGGQLAGTRNRIINGDMRIDQRNAGASVNTSDAYIVDRFRQTFSGGGVITGQRSTTVPAGFTNSLQATVTTADSSIAASDFYLVQHRVEGFNVADFGLGAAGASTFTLSFWVRSSVTGTYGVGFVNGSDNRSYPATYSVSVANTWEYKTITVAGDTSGTWLTDNGTGTTILFDLGSGSNFNGTAGAWASANTFRTSGCVNWIATSGATFYITGVQLEPGSTATPFERRSYGQELVLCQRYFQLIDYDTTNGGISANWYRFPIPFLTAMRAAPTMVASAVGSNTGNALAFQDAGTVNGWTLDSAYLNTALVRGPNGNLNRGLSGRGQFSSEL